MGEHYVQRMYKNMAAYGNLDRHKNYWLILKENKVLLLLKHHMFRTQSK